MFKQIGEELKAAREEANISVEYLSQKIKIDAKFVRNFENGDFTFLPDIYIKAFLKEIAKTIGLQETDIIQKYENAKKGKPLDTPSEQKKDGSEPQETVRQQPKIVVEDDSVKGGEIRTGGKAYSKKKERMLFLSIFGVIIVAIAVYFLFFANTTLEIVGDVPPPEERERFVVEDTVAQSEMENYIPGDSLQLNLRAMRELYVEIRPDRANKQIKSMEQNDVFIIRAKESFSLVLGHSDVKLTLNGREITPPESNGRIELEINEEGLVSD